MSHSEESRRGLAERTEDQDGEQNEEEELQVRKCPFTSYPLTKDYGDKDDDDRKEIFKEGRGNKITTDKFSEQYLERLVTLELKIIFILYYLKHLVSFWRVLIYILYVTHFDAPLNYIFVGFDGRICFQRVW